MVNGCRLAVTAGEINLCVPQEPSGKYFINYTDDIKGLRDIRFFTHAILVLMLFDWKDNLSATQSDCCLTFISRN